MVALFVMGCVLLLFCAFVVVGQRGETTSQMVTAMGADVEPASMALLAVIGAAMVILGSYPAMSPWQFPEPAAVSPTSGSLVGGSGGPMFSVRLELDAEAPVAGSSTEGWTAPVVSEVITE